MTTPDISEAWIDPIFDAIVDFTMQTGYFELVNKHEPKRSPSYTGLTAAVWLQLMRPAKTRSGLANCSAVLEFNLRTFSSMLQEPQDAIDPNLTRACSSIMRKIHGDFDFGGVISHVDLLGMEGTSLNNVMGYVSIGGGDSKLYRCGTMTIPCIVNDVWPQVQ